MTRTKVVEDGIVYLTREQQQKSLYDAAIDCFNKSDEIPQGFCPRIFDQILCWDPTPPGQLMEQQCPDYLNGFRINGTATRFCDSNGTWWIHPEHNSTWTNFSDCMVNVKMEKDQLERYNLYKEHLPRIDMIRNIGYPLSLASLVLAVIIMCVFKRLHCPKNVIHINLFLSFIIKGVFSILVDNLLVEGVGLSKDVMIDSENLVHFIEEGSHWECRLLITLFHYSITANYAWIFVEALYLHMLIFFSVFSEKSRVQWYIFGGWAAPICLVFPWAMVRLTHQNRLCWNVNWYEDSPYYLWIITAPITATTVVNFISFLNIMRVLFTKMKATPTPERRMVRYRKLAKSTFVLIVLFGVHYIIFAFIEANPRILKENPMLDVVKLYFDLTFSSFQGFLVAVLFCFINSDVRNEFCRKYQRYQLRNGSFGNSTNYTTAFTRPKPRGISDGSGSSDRSNNANGIRKVCGPIVYGSILPENGSASERLLRLQVNGACTKVDSTETDIAARESSKKPDQLPDCEEFKCEYLPNDDIPENAEEIRLNSIQSDTIRDTNMTESGVKFTDNDVNDIFAVIVHNEQTENPNEIPPELK